MSTRTRAVARLWAVLALVLSFAAPLASQSGTRYTTTALRLRLQASAEAAPLLTMPRGATVTVASCADRWCQVDYRGRSGYAARRYLSQNRPSAPSVSRNRPSARSSSECGSGGYVNSRGRWVPSPCSSPNGPPAGASARCRDGTYSFSQSRRGTCSRHGGVSRWL
ncbi:MAG TPA: DUF3761 domain-containing protein [Longimicrobium sp.]|nr:DUF3761 domain-containing protein [Longimicrobium sp.]